MIFSRCLGRQTVFTILPALYSCARVVCMSIRSPLRFHNCTVRTSPEPDGFPEIWSCSTIRIPALSVLSCGRSFVPPPERIVHLIGENDLLGRMLALNVFL